MTTLIVIFCIIIILTGIEIRRELKSFQVTRYHIETKKLSAGSSGKRVVFLSDLHNQTYGPGNTRLNDAIRKENPDLILVGGDMLVSNDSQFYENALKFVCGLTAVCPVYYANGNHEQRLKEKPEKYRIDYQSYKTALERSGVCVLENESVLLHWGESAVRITGLEIPMSCYRRMSQTTLLPDDITRQIGSCHAGQYQILLAHNPEYMKAYQTWGADLILSGHLHGGIVRIPKVTGVIAPSLRLFPKYSGGIYRQNHVTSVVSKGLGTHTVPLRLFNMPEVVVLDIKGI